MVSFSKQSKQNAPIFGATQQVADLQVFIKHLPLNRRALGPLNAAAAICEPKSPSNGGY